jgi:hypothetical protein
MVHGGARPAQLTPPRPTDNAPSRPASLRSAVQASHTSGALPWCARIAATSSRTPPTSACHRHRHAHDSGRHARAKHAWCAGQGGRERARRTTARPWPPLPLAGPLRTRRQALPCRCTSCSSAWSRIACSRQRQRQRQRRRRRQHTADPAVTTHHPPLPLLSVMGVTAGMRCAASKAAAPPPTAGGAGRRCSHRPIATHC